MIIQGTSKVRGVIQLNNPRLELASGKAIRVSKTDFNKPDVQTAINMGFLKVIPENPGNTPPSDPGTSPVPSPLSPNFPSGESVADDGERLIKCRNVYTRPLGFNLFYNKDAKSGQPVFNREVHPGQEFTLNEEQLNSPEIKAAIARGYVKVLSASGSKTTTTETTLDVTNALLIEQEKINEAAKKRNIGESSLDTNEELESPVEEIEGIKKKAVTFNPTSGNPIQAKSPQQLSKQASVIDDPNPEPVKSDEGPKNASVIWNPARNPVMNTRPATVVEKQADITFVDDEQDKEKIQKHPVLKDKPPENEDDILFADQIEEEKRISSHPILKDKPREKSGDVKFL